MDQDKFFSNKNYIIIWQFMVLLSYESFEYKNVRRSWQYEKNLFFY